MTNKNKDIEEILLTGTSLDDLIRMKIESEFRNEIANTKTLNSTNLKTIYTEIKDIPKELIFSKHATYRVFNRNTKLETFINGIQADALIGLQNNIRTKLLNKEISAFSTEDTYVKFEKACVK